ncbi:MAG: hypothetical protein Unbinned3325contig1000_27 [Prokaryotic dsDNA virus sp.]|nr:MAG: hypothetical protein Unbinned3325contig1000_27 [Prokaryotic dsDNA virus sp.]|tara:strand:- start:9538 stop:9678 length:141 start_codon:yes stop_codon:yes gene_type:complete
MIMFNIAEWIANVLILGLGVFFWVVAIGLAFMIIDGFIERMRYESS